MLLPSPQKPTNSSKSYNTCYWNSATQWPSSPMPTDVKTPRGTSDVCASESPGGTRKGRENDSGIPKVTAGSKYWKLPTCWKKLWCDYWKVWQSDQEELTGLEFHLHLKKRGRERERKQRKVCQSEREIVIMFFSLQATTIKFKQKKWRKSLLAPKGIKCELSHLYNRSYLKIKFKNVSD